MSRSSRRRAVMGSALSGAALATLILALPAHATFPGKNGRLAIMGMQTGDPGRMFTIAPDGTDPRRLSGTPATYTSSPVWSPDGRRIAYGGPLDELWSDGRVHVFTADPDGSDARRLTNRSWAGFPTWSPDGRRIAFQVSPEPEQRYEFGEIWVMNADGTRQKRISARGARDFNPTWSPGGSRIAFSSDRSWANGGTGSREIYNMKTDGTDVRRITKDQDKDDQPSFAPSGDRLVWASDLWTIDSGSSTTSAIWEADALTGRNYVRRTSGLGDAEPVVSPDGRWIAFSSNCRDTRCDRFRIYRVARNGSDPQLFTEWDGHAPDWQRLP